MQNKWSLFPANTRAVQHVVRMKIFQIGKYRYYIGITEPKQVNQDNSQQVSRI